MPKLFKIKINSAFPLAGTDLHTAESLSFREGSPFLGGEGKLEALTS